MRPASLKYFSRYVGTVFQSIFQNVKTISLKVLRGMRSEMLVDTPLTFSTIQKNNIPMFCSIFYSLWPSEKLGGTQLRGWRQSRSLSQSSLSAYHDHYASNMARQLLSVYSHELFMANKNCIYLNGASNGFSNFTSQLLTVKILCRDRDLLRGAGTAGGDLETVTLTMNHFSVSLRDAPEDKSCPDPRVATRGLRKQKRSHQFRSSLIPKIVELFIQNRHHV